MIQTSTPTQQRTVRQIARGLKMRASVAPDATHVLQFSADGAQKFADDLLVIEEIIRSWESEKAARCIREERKERVEYHLNVIVFVPVAACAVYGASFYVLSLFAEMLP